MTDVILAVLCPSILAFFVFVGRRGLVHYQKGWAYMLAGFAFVMYGVLINVTDSFFGLDSSIDIVNTESQELIATAIGYLPGFILLAIGFWKWVPTVTSLNNSQQQLQRSRDEFNSKIEEKASELMSTEEHLQQVLNERNQIEEALNRNAENYQGMLDGSIDGICIIDDGLIKYINPSLRIMTGYESSELTETPIAARIHPDAISAFSGLLNSFNINQNNLHKCESTWVRKDGSTLNVEINASAIKFDEVDSCLMIVRDMTERKLANEKIDAQYHEIQTYSRELEESKEDLQQTRKQLREASNKVEESEKELIETFENAKDGVLQLNLYGRIIDANLKVENILGYSRDELIRKNFEELDLFNSDQLAKMVDTLNAVAGGHTAPLREFEIRRRDGSTVFIDTRPSLMKKDGKPQSILAIIRDITKRKQAEQSLRKARDEMGLRIEERTSALAKASNELQLETTARRQ
ncbi:MAG: PAS domain S-box protein, partial [Chloroflexi bacterium]|nr:PAS domain S-box protein [Chloroflexota bacterium]